MNRIVNTIGFKLTVNRQPKAAPIEPKIREATESFLLYCFALNMLTHADAGEKTPKSSIIVNVITGDNPSSRNNGVNAGLVGAPKAFTNPSEKTRGSAIAILIGESDVNVPGSPWESTSFTINATIESINAIFKVFLTILASSFWTKWDPVKEPAHDAIMMRIGIRTGRLDEFLRK